MEIPYVVLEGDSLLSIAFKFNTTEDEIKSYNYLRNDYLQVGKTIFIKVKAIKNNQQIFTTEIELILNRFNNNAELIQSDYLNRDNILIKREPCGFVNQIGILILSNKTLEFIPHNSMTKSSFNLCDIKDPTIVEENDISIIKKASKFKSIFPQYGIKYLQFLANQNGRELLFLFAVHNIRIELFYPHLLEYSCNSKESPANIVTEIDQESLTLINQLLLEDQKSRSNVNSISSSSASRFGVVHSASDPKTTTTPAQPRLSPTITHFKPITQSKPTQQKEKKKFRGINIPNLSNFKKVKTTKQSEGGASSLGAIGRFVEKEEPFLSLNNDSPLLLYKSAILKEQHFHALSAIRNFLPTTFQRRAWDLLYSTDKHGFSLRTFYAKMLAANQATIMVVEDTRGNIFGGFASCPWKVQELYFGTGECFLFRLFPTFGLYSGRGDLNHFFMLAKHDHFEMGGGSTGKPGLWIDNDLCHGMSGCSETYLNEKLSSTEDFMVAHIEVWGFATKYIG